MHTEEPMAVRAGERKAKKATRDPNAKRHDFASKLRLATRHFNK